MTGKEILALGLVDDQTGIKDSIGDFICDIIDQALCEEVYDKIVDRRKLTEAACRNYDFYADPIWKKAWNKKVREITDVLRLK